MKGGGGAVPFIFLIGLFRTRARDFALVQPELSIGNSGLRRDIGAAVRPLPARRWGPIPTWWEQPGRADAVLGALRCFDGCGALCRNAAAFRASPAVGRNTGCGIRSRRLP